LEEAGPFEGSQELRNRGRRDGRPSGEIGSDNVACCDGTEHEELRRCQRRLECPEHSFCPAAEQGRDAGEGVSGALSRLIVPRPGHS